MVSWNHPIKVISWNHPTVKTTLEGDFTKPPLLNHSRDGSEKALLKTGLRTTLPNCFLLICPRRGGFMKQPLQRCFSEITTVKLPLQIVWQKHPSNHSFGVMSQSISYTYHFTKLSSLEVVLWNKHCDTTPTGSFKKTSLEGYLPCILKSVVGSMSGLLWDWVQQSSNTCEKFCAYDSMLLTNVYMDPACGREARCLMVTFELIHCTWKVWIKVNEVSWTDG